MNNGSPRGGATALRMRSRGAFAKPRDQELNILTSTFLAAADTCKLRYACAASVAGRGKWKVAPRPGAPAAHKRPPCDSMIDLLMGRPMPVPLSLVVKNALKICSGSSGDNPTPVSQTEITS